MIIIRKANERGRTRLDWLDSRHTFSFGDYSDANHRNFGCLRVINEDVVHAGKGFHQHPHHDMEIISYVVEGTLQHQDTLGTGSLIRPGEIQCMSAGTGIEHSEVNYSHVDPVHFLQIWIIPTVKGMRPGYQQKSIKKITNQLLLIGSHDPCDEAITIHQDVKLFVAYLTAGATVSYAFANGRRGWLHLIKGKVTVDNTLLLPGDGAGIEQIDHCVMTCLDDAELLFFDIA